MASKTLISELKDNVGQDVTLGGWLYRGRSSGKVLFLVVRDGTGLCQCIVEKGKIPDEQFEQLKRLGQESSLVVAGTVRAEQRSVGGYELAVTGAEILSSTTDYPITPKSHGIDFLLKHRHLHLRSQRQWCIGKIRHTVIDAARRFFNDNGFTLIDTPILTATAGEEEQTLFEVDYFDSPLHLAQTGQLYLESAAMSFGKVYCFGPTFRAERSKTRRHLTEFWMIEPEVAFIDLAGLLELAENFVSFIAASVLENNRSQLETLGTDIAAIEKIRPPFYRLSYTEAVEILTGEKTKKFMAEQLEELRNQKQQIETQIAERQQQQKGQLKQWKAERIAAELIELHSALAETDTKIENNPKHATLAAEFRWGKDLGGSDETIISQMHDKPVFVTHLHHCLPPRLFDVIFKFNAERPVVIAAGQSAVNFTGLKYKSSPLTKRNNIIKPGNLSHIQILQKYQINRLIIYNSAAITRMEKPQPDRNYEFSYDSPFISAWLYCQVLFLKRISSKNSRCL